MPQHLTVQGHQRPHIWGKLVCDIVQLVSRLFHRNLNRENLSSSFSDMHTAKFGPHWWEIWQGFGSWASPYGANEHEAAQLRTRKLHKTSEKNIQWFKRYALCKVQTSLQPIRPLESGTQYTSNTALSTVALAKRSLQAAIGFCRNIHT